jgi:hypothetical protein
VNAADERPITSRCHAKYQLGRISDIAWSSAPLRELRGNSHEGRDTDEQTLKSIEALFFEVYTGPDSVPNGYKEVDNAFYATTVPQQMLPLVELLFSCVPCLYSFTEIILLLKYYK